MNSSTFTTTIETGPTQPFQFGITAINQNGLSSPFVLYREVYTGTLPGPPSTCQAIPQTSSIALVQFTQPVFNIDVAPIFWFVTTTQYLNSTITTAKFGSLGSVQNRWFTGLSNGEPVKFLVNCVNDPGYSLPKQTNWLNYPYAFAQPSELIVWADASQLKPSTFTELPNFATNGGYTIEPFNSYSAPTLSSNQLNQFPVLGFTTSQALAVNPAVGNPAEYTLFTVSRQVGGANFRVFGSRSLNYTMGYIGGQKNILYLDGNPSFLSGAPSDTIWDIYSYTRTASNTDTVTSWYWNGSNLFENLVNTNSIPDLTFNGFFPPDPQLSDCEIAEVIMYTSSFGTDDRQKIEGYLAYKWGLQSNLPSNHPYKYTQP